MLLLLLSPAKSLSLTATTKAKAATAPVLKDPHAAVLKAARKLSKADLKRLMGISDALAALNHERYALWEEAPPLACGAGMDGPAFKKLDMAHMSAEECEETQKRVRILSGLYGVLKPCDTIAPYRLEMGTKLAVGEAKDLASFWRPHVVPALNEEFAAAAAADEKKVLVNAASQEYFAAVDAAALADDVELVTVEFKTNASVYAKQARGAIARYVSVNTIDDADGLRGFAGDGAMRWRFKGEREEPLAKGVTTRTQRVFTFEPAAAAAPAAKQGKGKGKGKAEAEAEEEDAGDAPPPAKKARAAPKKR